MALGFRMGQIVGGGQIINPTANILVAVFGNNNFATNVISFNNLTPGVSYIATVSIRYSVSAGTISARLVDENSSVIETQQRTHTGTQTDYTFMFSFTATTATEYIRVASSYNSGSQVIVPLTANINIP